MYLKPYLFSAIALFSLASATTVTDVEAQAACPRGAHIIVARGTTEAPGQGIIGTLARRIARQVRGTTSVGIDYPATFNYKASEKKGREAMEKAVRAYVKKCPHTPIVLLGYSQGAQVTLDALCGTSEKGWPETPPFGDHIGRHIAAVVTYGDPSFVPDRVYSRGTSTKKGAFPRRKPGQCGPWKHRIASYCDKGDVYCAHGRNNSVHGGYFDKYNKRAADFAVKKIRHHQL